ncbi:hypothetical protein K440DRAFT_188011 [Wilcoxina mikolae CBS 423.85]|nr:hypothetical protein K440DRAFT_188011 [Wilcoxina mikolae CBS 423.85]
MAVHHCIDTSAVDNSGRSALFLAAGAGFGACVEILLNHGLDKDHRDSFGRVALDVALKPEVRVLLKPDDEVPDQEAVFSCSNFTHIEQTDGKKNYSLANWDCDECSRKILSEFFYHCCKCKEDNYDLCATCFASKGGCNGEDDGPLKVRFWGDGMVSFSELSPWVAQSKLPGADE